MSDRIPENVAEKLRAIKDQHDDLASQLMDVAVLSNHKKVTSLSIKKAAIAPLVKQFESFEAALSHVKECEDLLGGDDAELATDGAPINPTENDTENDCEKYPDEDDG